MKLNKKLNIWWKNFSLRDQARIKFLALWLVLAGGAYYILEERVEDKTLEKQTGTIISAVIGAGATTFLVYRFTLNNADANKIGSDANRNAGWMVDIEAAERLCDTPFHREALDAAMRLSPRVRALHSAKVEKEQAYRLLPVCRKLEVLRKEFPLEIFEAEQRAAKK